MVITSFKSNPLNPALILRIPGGRMALGAPADLTIFSLDEPWTVNPEAFASKGRNTPFGGRKLKGNVKYTIVGGKIVYDAAAQGAHAVSD